MRAARNGATWWRCYGGHWRSGPRHLSPRSGVCAQEWYSEDIHSHIISHPPMHTPKNNSLNSPNMSSFTGPLPVQCGRGRRPGSLADAPQDCSTSEALRPCRPGTVLTENICRYVQQILEPALGPLLECFLYIETNKQGSLWLLCTAPCRKDLVWCHLENV